MLTMDRYTNSVRILPNSVRNTLDILGIDWDRYKQYLEKNFNKHTAKASYSYSLKYYQILVNGDASNLVVLSFDNRMHIMKAPLFFQNFWAVMINGKKS